MEWTVIILDDDPEDQEMCVRLLANIEDVRYRCFSIASKTEAMRLIEEEKVNCLLLDYSLPGENGLALLSQFRQAYPFLPVVMLTGHGNGTIAAEAIDLGAQDYIEKASLTAVTLHTVISYAIHQAMHLQSNTTAPSEAPVILIIDDNEDDRDVYIRYLRQAAPEGYQYMEATGGAEGIGLAHEKQPDCVLLDYSLPGYNGIEVLKQIREHNQFMPVIMLTGYGNEAIAVQAMKEGAFNYLPKAKINPEMLHRAVRSAIEHGTMERQIYEQKIQILQQKQELANFGHLMRAVLDSSAHMIVATNTAGVITLFNPAAEKALGYKAEEVIGVHNPLIWHDKKEMMAQAEALSTEYGKPVSSDDLSVLTLKALSEGKEIREWTLICKNGTQFPAIVTFTPLYEEGHVLAGYLAVLQDISEQKEADEFKRQLIAKLMESNTELERFAYVASHDMQEPLRMVANFGRLIAEEYHSKLDENGQQYLTLITESAQRMQLMIRDLLEYARTGHDSSHITTVNLEEELAHVLNNLMLAIQESKAEVTHDPLPELQGNAVQIMRLLQNIIGNALKYQAKDGIPKIHISCEDRDTHWCVLISDNGIGIREEHQSRIFEPFKRLHSWEQYQGSGVGLAVCKKIVENHGGKIWLKSEYGKGSTFYLTLSKQGGSHASKYD